MAVAVLLITGIAGCGGGSASGPPEAAGAPSMSDAVAQLEARGDLPVLDRTDTLAGIDANANGVRDDIERHIETKYTEPAQRKAAMQRAIVFQQMLLVDKRDEAALDAVSYRGTLAIVCSMSAFPGAQGTIEKHGMGRELESMTTNTKARLMAYLAYNKARSGSVSTLPREPACD